MELPSGYRAERINNENFKDFVIIHRKAFKSDIKAEFPERKFNTCHHSGIENIGYIIYHSDGEPVSYYGVYPMYAVIDKKKGFDSPVRRYYDNSGTYRFGSIYCVCPINT